MTVLPFIARTARSSWTVQATSQVPAVSVKGAFNAPSGRAGTFTGSYRLEHCVSLMGQLAVAGVLTGRLTDADGSEVGICARRTIVAAKAEATGTAVCVQLVPLDVDLLGLLVSVPEISVDVRGTSCERAVREALRSLFPPPAINAVAGKPPTRGRSDAGTSEPTGPRAKVERSILLQVL